MMGCRCYYVPEVRHISLRSRSTTSCHIWALLRCRIDSSLASHKFIREIKKWNEGGDVDGKRIVKWTFIYLQSVNGFILWRQTLFIVRMNIHYVISTTFVSDVCCMNNVRNLFFCVISLPNRTYRTIELKGVYFCSQQKQRYLFRYESDNRLWFIIGK